MKTLLCTVAVAVALIAFSPDVCAQCAKGTVTLRGRVENLRPGGEAEVSVVLETPKGQFSKTTAVADGQFQVVVDFDTLKSWSPLWGHRCSNAPKFVGVTVKQADRVLAQKKLPFAESFETRDSLSYTLKRELTIDASQKAAR